MPVAIACCLLIRSLIFVKVRCRLTIIYITNQYGSITVFALSFGSSFPSGTHYWTIMERTSRKTFYNHVLELARHHRFVFKCFECGDFVIGRKCLQHHFRGHCLHEVGIQPIRATREWIWLDCEKCDRQRVFSDPTFASLHRAQLFLRWAALVSCIIKKAIRFAEWKCTSRRPINALPSVVDILGFL